MGMGARPRSFQSDYLTEKIFLGKIRFPVIGKMLTGTDAAPAASLTKECCDVTRDFRGRGVI
jgi:hypothetical protein